MILDMNRRNFLLSSAALAAPVALRTNAAESTTGDIRLGVATYSLREFSRDNCIRMVKLLNVDYVDIKEFHLPQTDPPKALAAGRVAFDKAGLKVIGGGNITMNETDEAGLRPHFEYAKTVGFPIMIIAPTHENLPLIEKLVKEYNIRVAIHNHGPGDKNFPTPQSVLDAVRTMDPRVGLCIDIGHTTLAGVDVVQAIAAAGPRLFETHFRDLNAKNVEVPVGDGVIPIPAIFRQLMKQGYPGTCSLEQEMDGFDPLPGMQKSFAYMRGVVAGMKA
jgi:sugar phosphate isomerase/epimerase